ncbi:cytochrome b/b6 domain-containing protein [Ideonella sp. 4Y16]|nr:cytochrome b/b6 domain-containing protein [Ideonella alba]
MSRVRVWDVPVRVFHWLLVLSFAGAWLSAESERWRLLHVTLGYTVAGLVAFRVVWGLVGTKPARFASFVRGPAAVLAYLKGLLAGRAPHTTGHNPAGALAIVGLLGLAALTTGLGWATYNELGGDLAEEGHELAANLMLLLVGVHLLGVLVGSLAHRENLVRAMFTGHKRGQPDEGAQRAWAPLGALLLALVLGFWAWQWRSAPQPAAAWQTAAVEPAQAQGPLAALKAMLDDDDDDDDDKEGH